MAKRLVQIPRKFSDLSGNSFVVTSEGFSFVSSNGTTLFAIDPDNARIEAENVDMVFASGIFGGQVRCLDMQSGLISIPTPANYLNIYAEALASTVFDMDVDNLRNKSYLDLLVEGDVEATGQFIGSGAGLAGIPNSAIPGLGFGWPSNILRTNPFISSNGTTGTVTANRLFFQPIMIPGNYTISELSISVNTPGAGGTVHQFGLFTESNGLPLNKVYDSGSIATAATTSCNPNTIVTAGPYWMGYDTNSAGTLQKVSSNTSGAGNGLSGGMYPYITHTAGTPFPSVITGHQWLYWSNFPMIFIKRA